MQQSITGSLRPRNANVAPTDPSTGIRVSSGNTGNSGNASRTLGSGTGTASQYPALESYQRTLDSMGRRGLLTGATAAGWNASHPTEAAAVRLNELITANRPAGTTGSTANSAGTGGTAAASAGGNTGSGNTASAGGSTGSTGSAGSTGSTGTRRNDQMRDWRVWLDNYDAKYGGDIMSFDPSTLSGDDLVRYYQDLNIYTSLASTVSAYDAEVEAAEQAAREKEQYAAYRRAMLQKYLPETLSAMGLDGRGTSESAIIQMNNNIDNYVAGAMSEKNAAQSSALQQYRQLAAQMMQERNNQLIQNAQESEAEYDSYYDQLVSDYLSGNPDFDVQTVKQYLDMGLIDQSRYDKFMEQYNSSTLTSLGALLGDDSVSLTEKKEAYDNAMADENLSDATKQIIQNTVDDTVRWANGMTITSSNISDFVDDGAYDMVGRTYMIEGDGVDANVVDNADIDAGFGHIWGKAGKRVRTIKDAALNGVLKDGDIVDFNYGQGENFYVYLGGKFYKLHEL